MKQFCFIRMLIIVALLSIVHARITHAATFCVSDATELQDALTVAASNGENDTIQIVQGTYVGNFIYESTEANSLALEGGYNSGCGSRILDPENTILNEGVDGTVFEFSASNSFY